MRRRRRPAWLRPDKPKGMPRRPCRSLPPRLLSEQDFLQRVNAIYGQAFSELKESMAFLRQERNNGAPPYSGVHIDVYYNFWMWRSKIPK